MEWGELYAYLITATGWTWEYIRDHMTIPRLTAMNAYWEKVPPTYLGVYRLCSAYLKTESAPSVSKPDKGINDFLSEWGGAGRKV